MPAICTSDSYGRAYQFSSALQAAIVNDKFLTETFSQFPDEPSNLICEFCTQFHQKTTSISKRGILSHTKTSKHKEAAASLQSVEGQMAAEDESLHPANHCWLIDIIF